MRLETLHSRPPCAADTADSSARAHKPHGVVHIIHARLLAHLLACLRPVLAVLAVRGLVRERAAPDVAWYFILIEYMLYWTGPTVSRSKSVEVIEA